MGNFSDLAVHSTGTGAADDLLLSSRAGFGPFGECDRGAGIERAAAARIPRHRYRLAYARSILRMAARNIAACRELPCALGTGLAHSRSARVARRRVRVAADRRSVAQEHTLDANPRTCARGHRAALLTAIAIHPFPPDVQRGSFELTTIDVGQGDSLLTAFPSGQLLLVDAGGIAAFGRTRRVGIDIGEDVISPYLWTRSIKHLDVVAMTHAHEDHIGGMVAILKNFRPRELWIGAAGESPEWRRVRKAAHDLGIPVRQLQQSAPFPYGGATVQVLAPLPDYAATATPQNNDSLVMRVQFGSTSFLLTGDMEKKIEEQLYAEGELQPADVLKVGHHGSRTSSTADLLDAVHPAFGLISVGYENSYGHPHPLTMAALQAHHVAVYRTDEQGLVRVISDGRRIQITVDK